MANIWGWARTRKPFSIMIYTPLDTKFSEESIHTANTAPEIRINVRLISATNLSPFGMQQLIEGESGIFFEWPLRITFTFTSILKKVSQNTYDIR